TRTSGELFPILGKTVVPRLGSSSGDREDFGFRDEVTRSQPVQPAISSKPRIIAPSGNAR
ncbi:MAG: hypothetical protein LAT52_12595, partial [Balneolales bacterium]|nr:hypothetical protein [Balneolales bacterium]